MFADIHKYFFMQWALPNAGMISPFQGLMYNANPSKLVVVIYRLYKLCLRFLNAALLAYF
jgi:hypothetical protein